MARGAALLLAALLLVVLDVPGLAAPTTSPSTGKPSTSKPSTSKPSTGKPGAATPSVAGAPGVPGGTSTPSTLAPSAPTPRVPLYSPIVPVAQRGGASNCPCIKPDLLSYSASKATAGGNCSIGTDGTCYPLWYGASGQCEMFDSIDPKTQAKANCSFSANAVDDGVFNLVCSAWCFVNKADCARPNEPSEIFPGLAISYESCGFIGVFSQQETFGGVKSSLQERGLRVTYPPTPPDYYMGTRNATDGSLIGVMPEYLRSILQESGIEIVETEISATAHKVAKELLMDNVFDACIYDVALNNTDICVVDYWATDQRARVAPFTASVLEDQFYLVKVASDDDHSLSFGAAVERTFKPFTAGAWIMILANIVIYSILIYLIERCEQGEKLQLHSEPDGESLNTSLFRGLLSFNGGDSRHEVKSWSANLVNGAFGLMLMFTFTAYGANLATFLVASALKPPISDLASALRAGNTICYQSVMAPVFRANYPELGPGSDLSRVIYKDDATEMFASLNNGSCDFALVGVNDYLSSVFASNSRECNKVIVGSPVAVMSVAFPVRPEIQQFMSLLVLQGRLSGSLEKIHDDATTRLLSEECKYNDSVVLRSTVGVTVYEDPSPAPLTVYELSGVFVVPAAAGALGVLSFLAVMALRARRARGTQPESPRGGDDDKKHDDGPTRQELELAALITKLNGLLEAQSQSARQSKPRDRDRRSRDSRHAAEGSGGGEGLHRRSFQFMPRTEEEPVAETAPAAWAGEQNS